MPRKIVFVIAILLVSLATLQSVQPLRGMPALGVGKPPRSFNDAHQLMFVSQAIMENEPYQVWDYGGYDKLASLAPMPAAQGAEDIDMQLIEAMLNAVKAEINEWNTYCRQGRVAHKDDPCELEKLEQACGENLARLESQYRELRNIWGDRRKALTKLASSFNRTRRRVWGNLGPVGRRVIRNLGEEVGQILSAKHAVTRGVLRSLLRKQFRQELRTYAIDQIVKKTQVTLPDRVCDEPEEVEPEVQEEAAPVAEEEEIPERELASMEMLIDLIYQEWFRQLEEHPCQPELIMEAFKAWANLEIATQYEVEGYYGEGQTWATYDAFIGGLIEEATAKDVTKTWKGDYSATYTPIVDCQWCAPTTEAGEIILTVDLATCVVGGSYETYQEEYVTTKSCVDGVPVGEDNTFYIEVTCKGTISGIVGISGALDLDPITFSYDQTAGWLDEGMKSDVFTLEGNISGSLDFKGKASGTRYFLKDNVCEYIGLWEAEYDPDN